MIALCFAKKIQGVNCFYALYISISSKHQRMGELLLLPDFDYSYLPSYLVQCSAGWAVAER